jgi:hypothetical protein
MRSYACVFAHQHTIFVQWSHWTQSQIGTRSLKRQTVSCLQRKQVNWIIWNQMSNKYGSPFYTAQEVHKELQLTTVNTQINSALNFYTNFCICNAMNCSLFKRFILSQCAMFIPCNICSKSSRIRWTLHKKVMFTATLQFTQIGYLTSTAIIMEIWKSWQKYQACQWFPEN